MAGGGGCEHPRKIKTGKGGAHRSVRPPISFSPFPPPSPAGAWPLSRHDALKLGRRLTFASPLSACCCARCPRTRTSVGSSRSDDVRGGGSQRREAEKGDGQRRRLWQQSALPWKPAAVLHSAQRTRVRAPLALHCTVSWPPLTRGSGNIRGLRVDCVWPAELSSGDIIRQRRSGQRTGRGPGMQGRRGCIGGIGC